MINILIKSQRQHGVASFSLAINSHHSYMVL